VTDAHHSSLESGMSDSRFQASVRLHQKGDLAGAVSGYRRVLAEDPTHSGALWNLGVALKAAKRWAEAERAIRNVVRLQPDNLDALRSLRFVLSQQANWPAIRGVNEAIALRLRAAIEKAPRSGEALRAFGQFFLEVGRPANAEPALREAVAVEGNNSDNHYLLGLSLRQQGKASDAIESFANALGRSGGADAARTALFELLREQGRDQRTSQFFGPAPADWDPDERTLWTTATAAWAAGDTVATYQTARTLWKRGRRAAEVAKILSAVAIEMNAYPTAARFTEMARNGAGPRKEADRPRYLMIKAICAGFWGEVNHALSSAVFAEITGRQPLVHWGPECRYSSDGSENGWAEYFTPLSQATPEALRGMELSYAPEGWDRKNLLARSLNRLRGPYNGSSALSLIATPADVVVSDRILDFNELLDWIPEGHPLSALSASDLYRYAIETYLRPQPWLEASIDALKEKHFTGHRLIAVHFRAQSQEKTLDSREGQPITPEAYFQHIDRILRDVPDGRIFLLSDSVNGTAQFSAQYGDRLIQLDTLRLEDDRKIGLEFDLQHEGRQLAFEVIRDCMLAAACDHFIGDGASSVSVAIQHLKRWPEGRAQLLRKTFLLSEAPIWRSGEGVPAPDR
jgi:tetratricopeptide (TPR) repeat protein